MKYIITESQFKKLYESESRYIICGEANHLMGKGMFLYTDDGDYSLVTNSIEFRRRMGENEIHPKIFDNRKDADKELKMIKKNVGRSDIRWYIKTL